MKYTKIQSSNAKDNSQSFLIFKPFENRTQITVEFLGIDEVCYVKNHVIHSYLPNENANFVLFEMLTVLSSTTCTYDRISLMLNDLVYSNRSIRIVFTNRILTFTVQPFKRMVAPGSFYVPGDYDYTKELYFYFPEPSQNSEPDKFSATVELERPYQCPFIILNDTQLCRLHKYLEQSDNCSKDALQYTIKNIDITADNGEYRVCFEDYLSVFSGATVSEGSVYFYLHNLVKINVRIVSLLLTIILFLPYVHICYMLN